MPKQPNPWDMICGVNCGHTECMADASKRAQTPRKGRDHQGNVTSRPLTKYGVRK